MSVERLSRECCLGNRALALGCRLTGGWQAAGVRGQLLGEVERLLDAGVASAGGVMRCWRQGGGGRRGGPFVGDGRGFVRVSG